MLRITAPAMIPDSHSRTQEFAILKVMEAKESQHPRPISSVATRTCWGANSSSWNACPGSPPATGWSGDASLEGEALTERLAQELGRIHAIRPPREDLAFLNLPEPTPALEMVARFRRQVEAEADPHPVLDWVLRWMALNAPRPQALVLCHRDFRTGNYLVEAGAFTGLLDWEFANWGIRWRTWAGSAPSAGVSGQ